MTNNPEVRDPRFVELDRMYAIGWSHVDAASIARWTAKHGRPPQAGDKPPYSTARTRSTHGDGRMHA